MSSGLMTSYFGASSNVMDDGSGDPPEVIAVRKALDLLPAEIGDRLKTLFGGAGGLSFADLDTRCIGELAKLHVTLQSKVVGHLESERVFLCNSRSKSRFLLSTCERARHGALDQRGFGAIDPWKSVLNSVASSNCNDARRAWERENGWREDILMYPAEKNQFSYDGSQQDEERREKELERFREGDEIDQGSDVDPRNLQIDVADFPEFVDLLGGEKYVTISIHPKSTTIDVMSQLIKEWACPIPPPKMKIRRLGSRDDVGIGSVESAKMLAAMSQAILPGQKQPPLLGPVMKRFERIIDRRMPKGAGRAELNANHPVIKLRLEKRERGGQRLTLKKMSDLSKAPKGSVRVPLLALRMRK